jgi:hypothetical protein
MSEDKRPEEVIAQAPTSSKTKTDNKELASFEHEQIIQKANIGIFGKLLGGGSEKAGNISGIIVTLLIIYVSVVTYFYLIHDKTAALELLETPFSIITLILGYLFGSSVKK